MAVVASAGSVGIGAVSRRRGDGKKDAAVIAAGLTDLVGKKGWPRACAGRFEGEIEGALVVFASSPAGCEDASPATLLIKGS